MIEGFLHIDKPTGITSYDVIRHLKRLLPKGTKIGHAGTLDPLATGLLIIGIGRSATKQFADMIKLDKEYKVTALLGKTYDTQDITGKLLEEKDTSKITREAIIEVIKKFKGEIEQIPPMYSAIKHKGQPLYKLARKGEEIVRKARMVIIHSIEITSFELPRVKLRISCSSGTYIRTLVDDIGKELKVGASVEELRRTKIDNFSIKQATVLEKIQTEDDIKNLCHVEQRL